jgi:lysophospholipase L1-like esterase
MKRTYVLQAASSVGILITALGLFYVAPAAPDNTVGRDLYNLVAISRGRYEGWESIRSQTTGYYQSLLGNWRLGGKTALEWILNPSRSPENSDPYAHGGFLRYAPKPNLHWVSLSARPGDTGARVSGDDPRALDTNSYGLTDREYPLEKAPNIRRIAWLGDSVSRGFGVESADRFESRIETRLNEEAHRLSGLGVEVLNFSVDGYRTTQLYYVGVEKAPEFRPDVYILTLTELSIAPNWGAHLAQLVCDGQDLRFDFLRRVVRDAQLQPDDLPATVEAKLAAYRLPVLRQILRRLQSMAHSQGAEFVVVLLPAVEDSGTIARRFEGVHDLVAGMGITVVDLLDTFDSVWDVESLRVAWFDLHPNAKGHQLIADNLYRKLRNQPATWSALTGNGKTAG